ncbi:hypothetical protein QQZ08_011394 [Neonectria magnoliae]|uniref:Uncharacterized protein n=1 Tax=Neonectria magnoliae TaxID=2732573 RepID=A0ABR1HAE2_9HYPO
MSDKEADRLVRAMLEDDEITKEETSLLSSRLEHLPLALAQAAAYVQENSISIGDYIKLLDEVTLALWIQIKKRNPVASEFLALICLFNRQAIPKCFVTDYYNQRRLSEIDRSEEGGTKVTKVTSALGALPGIPRLRQNAIPRNVAVDDCPRRWPEESRSPEAEVIDAIGVLKAFSFISEGKNQNLDMHRLVQLTMRKWLLTEQEMAVFADWALFTVLKAYPPGEFENRESKPIA